MKKLSFRTVVFGCDPEFFFSKNGKVIGAEKILPKDGLEYQPNSTKKKDGAHTSVTQEASKIIIDGVQAELNPRANTCRANLANEISCCFAELSKKIKDNKDVKLDFNSTVPVEPEELNSLSDKAKHFGCSPSKNINGRSKISIKDSSKYYFRSAGGHLHLGHTYGDSITKDILKNPKRLVPILDLIVGNTCVLIDRNEGNIERRKVYGKAGEYRTPAHGIEYRTLSNFWLQSYQLMSFVTGLARMAVCIVYSDLDKEFLSKVNMKDVQKAINENDFELALSNFNKIKDLIKEVTPNNEEFPFPDEDSVDNFLHFVKKGSDYWFKEDILKHWINLPEGHDSGWETFLGIQVRKDRMKVLEDIMK